MASAALKQLQLLHKTLYERAYAEAHSLVAGTSRTILSYSDKFEASLPDTVEKTTQLEVVEALRKHRFLLYGDFHALKQSQRGLLRLLRAYSQKYRNAPIVLALEMFKQKDQGIIDSYINGEINDNELLVATNYSREWGFPWPNFKSIIEFAASRGLPIICINSEKAGKDSLQVRDSFASELLLDAAEEYPDHLIVCLIGEYHLADSHLPKAIKHEALRRGFTGDATATRVLSNVDRYYFQLQADSPATNTRYLKLKQDLYCIMNSPPWMKWQSYSIWEEMRSSGYGNLEFDPGEVEQVDIDEYTEESFDIDYQFMAMTKNLAGFLGFKETSIDLSNFNITYSPDGSFDAFLDSASWAPPRIRSRMVGRANLDGFYYVNETNNLLITSLSINNLAEAAGQHLHRTLGEFSDRVDDPAELFYRKVVKAMIGVIGSKILNPRRKVPLLANHRTFLAKTARRKLLGHAATRREVSKAVLRHHSWMLERLERDEGKFRAPIPKIYNLDMLTDHEVAQSIGYIMGHNVYKRVMGNKISTVKVRDIFRRSTPDFPSVWRLVSELYALIDP